MSKSTSSNSGIGFLGLLQVLFIGLKLTGHIDWSWFLVLAPILFPVLALFGVLIVIGGSYAIKELTKNRR